MPRFTFNFLRTTFRRAETDQAGVPLAEESGAGAHAAERDARTRPRESRSARDRLHNLTHRMRPDHRNRQGNTALHRAIQSRDVQAVRRQLQRGSDPNLALANHGQTPLAMAIAAGDAGLPMVEALLADPRT